MRLSAWTDPTSALKRLGVLDAVPSALARMNGAMKLSRTYLTGEGTKIAPSPYTVLCQDGPSTLVHYVPRTAPRHKTPVLLVPSVINRPYILDLMDGVSVVQALLDQGFDVYCIDWGDPTPAHEKDDLQTYVTRLEAFLAATCADAGTADAHLLGQCLGGTLTTILGAVADDKVRSLVNLTAPISFDDTGILSAWSRAPFFDARAFAEVFGNVPTFITQPSFVLLKPLSQPSKIFRLFQNLGNEKFLTFFAALETWINDNVSIAKGFYVDLITGLYREDALVRGKLEINGRQVVLENVEKPILTIAASEDHIVPPPSALVGQEHFSAKVNETLVIPGGHIGVVVGGRGKRLLHKTLGEWFTRHGDALGENKAAAAVEAAS